MKYIKKLAETITFSDSDMDNFYFSKDNRGQDIYYPFGKKFFFMIVINPDEKYFLLNSYRIYFIIVQIITLLLCILFEKAFFGFAISMNIVIPINLLAVYVFVKFSKLEINVVEKHSKTDKGLALIFAFQFILIFVAKLYGMSAGIFYVVFSINLIIYLFLWVLFRCALK